MIQIKGINSKIKKQEEKDFYIASRILTESFNPDMNIEVSPTPDMYYVDLWGICKYPDGDNVKFNVEIKEIKKDNSALIDSPYAELKVDKYNRMRLVTDSDTKLFYMVLLNDETCYLYDLDNPDVWKDVKIKEWKMKRTQFSPEEDMITVNTYFFPYSSATRKINYSCIYRDWFINELNYGLDKES